MNSNKILVKNGILYSYSKGVSVSVSKTHQDIESVVFYFLHLYIVKPGKYITNITTTKFAWYLLLLRKNPLEQ